MLIMIMNEKRDIRPALLKFGVALAISLGGILYSIIRNKRMRPSQSPPSPRSSDCSNQVDSAGEGARFRIDHHDTHSTPGSCNTASVVPEKHESCLPKVIDGNLITGHSPTGGSNGDRDGFLLPEFNAHVKEFDLAATRAGISPRKDVETADPDAETPRGYKCVERDEQEQEIKNLRNMVRILKEREKNLEIQLLEYYGLKEQETAVMELQNRLKINNMEAKLFSLKIESLQTDHKRLEAQVADHAKVVAELEAARGKMKLLKKKLRSEVEQNREQILTLQQRVTKLHDQEHKAVASDSDIQLKLQKVKDLEKEIEELRKCNSSLEVENSDLAQRLEHLQIFATSALEDEKTEALQEETHRLRQENEDLVKQMERLQADRCTDVEELVYLRWLNACLRYELRNYRPGPGKTIARDLSKTLSPKSEEKAKQLIVEYANKEGLGERGIDITDFDFDKWSSSQASYLTDSGELDDSPVDNSTAGKTNTSSKSKVFNKLKNILRGRDSSHHHSRNSSMETASCVEEVAGTYSGDSSTCNSGVSAGIDAETDGRSNRLKTSSGRSLFSSQGSSRRFLDVQKSLHFPHSKSMKVDDNNSLEQRNSDAGSFCISRRIDSITEGVVTDSFRETQLRDEPENVEKSELLKYAEVLRVSRGKTSKFGRRSMAHSSF